MTFTDIGIQLLGYEGDGDLIRVRYIEAIENVLTFDSCWLTLGCDTPSATLPEDLVNSSKNLYRARVEEGLSVINRIHSA